jgi:DNA polymerase-3 subunit delta'
LIERDGISPDMAEFAALAAQGHVGKAKYLATNSEARKTREKVLNIPFTVNDLAATFDAAATLMELAKEQAKIESEAQDKKEVAKLKESYGSTGSKLATGGTKALKELEKEQKSRSTRLVRDNLDRALLDLATVYRDILLAQSNSIDKITNIDFQNKIIQKAEESSKELILNSINSILKAKNGLSKNSASNLTTEVLLVSIRLGK